MRYIDHTATVTNSTIEEIRLYRNSVVSNSTLGNYCSIGDDSTIERCTFEDNVVINRRNYINDSFIGKFSYTGLNAIIRFTKLGRYCSLAPNIDIGGMDHDYNKVTTLPEFRYNQILGKKVDVSGVDLYGNIGNDVWIATGAIILRKCNVGDGAIVGAGAVVTHDVPPYAIVAGVPATIIGYRFRQEYIERLLEIRWWDWPDEIIKEKMVSLIRNEVDDGILKMMERVTLSL